MEDSSFIEHLNTALWQRAINIVSNEGHAFDSYAVGVKFEQLKQEAAEWLATNHITEQRLESSESRESYPPGRIPGYIVCAQCGTVCQKPEKHGKQSRSSV